MPATYPCPSCGFIVFDDPPGSYEICQVCGWEDDIVQLRNPDYRGGANGGSLRDYQTAILQKLPAEVRTWGLFIRHADWRPLTNDANRP
jgi:hypothetical protein